MDCAEIRTLALPNELGRLTDTEKAEFVAHTESCDECKRFVEKGARVAQVLSTWREATTEWLGEEDFEDAVKVATTERQREAPPKKSSPLMLIVVTLLIAAGATFAYLKFNVTTSGDVTETKDPLKDAALVIRNAEDALDFAACLDVRLLAMWGQVGDKPSESKLARNLLARFLARREGFAERAKFVRVLFKRATNKVTENATDGGPGAVDGGPETDDPLRICSELESDGSYELAKIEAEKVLNKSTGQLTKRANLHIACAELMLGNLEKSEAALNKVFGTKAAPKKEIAPSEDEITDNNGDAPACNKPRRTCLSFLVEDLRERINDARTARAQLETYERMGSVKDADDRGGALAIKALDFDMAHELLKGKDPTWTSQLMVAWMTMLRGDNVLGAKLLNDVASGNGSTYFRSTSRLGLSEIAYNEGRFSSGAGLLHQARMRAPLESSATRYKGLLMLYQGLRSRINIASVMDMEKYFDAKKMKSEKVPSAMIQLVEKYFITEKKALIEKRDTVTSLWPKGKDIYNRGAPPPGTVRATPYLELNFKDGVEGLRSTYGAPLPVDGHAQYTRASNTGEVHINLAKNFTEVETWFGFAIKPEKAGSVTVTLNDKFIWQTSNLQPDKWNRVLLPLMALEPISETKDATPLAINVSKISIGYKVTDGNNIKFGIDDIFIHHGKGAFGKRDRAVE